MEEIALVQAPGLLWLRPSRRVGRLMQPSTVFTRWMTFSLARLRGLGQQQRSRKHLRIIASGLVIPALIGWTLLGVAPSSQGAWAVQFASEGIPSHWRSAFDE